MSAIQVFSPDQPSRSRAYTSMSQEDAQALVDQGMATIMRSGRSIRLTELGTMKLRDRSCSWSHRLMDLVAQGNKTACEMRYWMGKRQGRLTPGEYRMSA